jgi:HK97 family phage major capsid protein
MSAEESAKFTAAEADLNSAGKEIEARERAAEIRRVMDAPAPTPGLDALPGAVDSRAAREGREGEYNEAFSRYLRRGMYSLAPEQRDRLETGFTRIEARDMGEATGAAGGYLVPPGFLAKITEVLKFFGGVRLVANVIETATGQGLVWPVNDDTSNPAVIIAENTQVSEGDLTLSQKALGAVMWNTKAVRIGRALMQDSAFNLESVVADRFAKRFGRGQNTAYTTGTGISGGIVSATSALTGDGTHDPLVDTSGAWSVYKETLLPLLHSVDVAYRQTGRCVWMMNDNSVQKVQSLLDANNRPLFVPAGSFGSLATGTSTRNGAKTAGGVDTLLGYEIVVNNDLPDSGATGGGVPVVFGDFQSGYIIRDIVGSTAVLRLEERYADFGEIGFIGYSRSDGNTDDPNALRVLTNHA